MTEFTPEERELGMGIGSLVMTAGMHLIGGQPRSAAKCLTQALDVLEEKPAFALDNLSTIDGLITSFDNIAAEPQSPQIWRELHTRAVAFRRRITAAQP